MKNKFSSAFIWLLLFLTLSVCSKNDLEADSALNEGFKLEFFDEEAILGVWNQLNK